MDEDHILASKMSLLLLSVTSVEYLFCHFGDILTQRYKDMRTITYHFDWHLYPLDTRKSILLMMNLADKKVYLKGFGSFGCDRKVFKTVRWLMYSITRTIIHKNSFFFDFQFSANQVGLQRFYGSQKFLITDCELCFLQTKLRPLYSSLKSFYQIFLWHQMIWSSFDY